MFTKKVSLIAATTKKFGIGFNNALPWKINNDLKYFKKITSDTSNKNLKNAVIMGNNTYKSINRLLPNRYNFILTKTRSQSDLTKKIINNNPYNININNPIYVSFEDILSDLFCNLPIERYFVIGGAEIYDLFLKNEIVNDIIYMNQVSKDYNCDTFFPFERLKQQGYVIKNKETVKVNDGINDLDMDIMQLKKYPNNQTEYPYLNVLNDIIKKGDKRQTRNAVTYSLFDKQVSFDVSESFPLLTTKRMFLKGIIEELLFFLKGDTNSKHLEDKGVKIWKDNTTREFLDSRGLNHYKEGDMGPMYFWNWRHFGAVYKGCDHNYNGEGFDQLKDVLTTLKNDPMSRRLMLTVFDPSKVSESVLAPCHSLILQFYVQGDKLSCKMYQRSVDSFLGEPFNIASSSLLLYLIAHVSGLKPYKITIDLGDTHIYENHLDQVQKQLSRIPFEFPQMKIIKKFNGDTIDDQIKFLESLKYEDFELSNYNHHKGIKASMIA